MKYFTCSAGKPNEDYVEENLNRIIDNKGFVLHTDTKQKGTFKQIGVNDILILKYNGTFIAYGKVIKKEITNDDGWNHWAFVEEWHFYNQQNPKIGISYRGIDANTVGGGKYGTVKTIADDFGFLKIKEINDSTTLFLSIYKKNNFNQMDSNLQNKINLLQYKKQIILQGPPGTGKTREAKLIVDDIFDSEIKDEINQEFLNNLLIPGYNYQLSTITVAKIVSKTGERITLDIASPNQPPVNFTIKEVFAFFESKAYLDRNHLDYTPNAIRSLLLFIIKQLRKSKIEEQFKLIQFHPSYTYEDFVRGIVAKPNPEGEGIIYDAENKTLADFAEKALKNYKAYNNSDTISIPTLKDFINIIIEEIDEKEKYQLTDKVYIYYVDEKRLKYKGDNWTAHPNGLNMNFSEIQKILDARHTTRQEISKNENLNALTRQHATYYQKFIELFQEFKVKNQTKETQNVPLRKYMLVIDEINRANLSSVLGELIYALEYRGEAVDSVYEVNGRDLILPPNLYIIGTMNTADRSVGHIDYAIRRRFAFVDILPKDLSQEQGIKFDSTLFTQVSNLFNEHTSPEFQQKDIQLGHSYFIDKSATGGNMQVRLDYEIKPILQEYVKDGILIGDEIVEKINRLTPSI
ncbi:dynein-related subfamily AAA family protein [Elizabethkingia miricola]|uniref:Dynein-related subfamily AAA family protein n=1 Tax=Elizabethkingia miricola TaxID=172045 RepID=A0ABY3NBK2_ELIMR|nr:AAA family ATPase [Elizabethkingia miricola]TYO85165.1 dynein-related subfamily AAA family protein [Elizabethkingia miricola]